MTEEDRLSPEVRAVATVVIVGAIMSILDTTIVNVALETLARELKSPLSTIQWVSTGYMLALAIVIPLTGWMSAMVECRSRRSVASATLTIVVSRIDMIEPTMTTALTRHTWAPMRSLTIPRGRCV